MKKFFETISIIFIVVVIGFTVANGMKLEEKREQIHSFWIQANLEYGKYENQVENPLPINEWIHSQNVVEIPKCLNGVKWYFDEERNVISE